MVWMVHLLSNTTSILVVGTSQSIPLASHDNFSLFLEENYGDHTKCLGPSFPKTLKAGIVLLVCVFDCISGNVLG